MCILSLFQVICYINYYDLSSLCSYGETAGRAEAAAGKTMSDQPGTAEAK